jgi:cobalamin-dependent methionine synthase I
MSGLLVKSTLIMKENLQLMKGRGIEIPVVLGGAALTRRYVEHDLREIYGPNVAYAEDAFAGLRYMERLANGAPLAGTPEAAAGPASQENIDGAETAKAQRRLLERDAIRIRHPFEEELEMLGEIMGVEAEDLIEADIDELYVAELNGQVIGGGRLMKTSSEDEIYELTNIAMLPEQWTAGAGMELVRAMRRAARRNDQGAEIYVTCDPDDKELARFYRTLGFDAVQLDDPRSLMARDKVNYCVETYGRSPALFFSKPASAISDGPAREISRHLQQEQEQDADFPVAATEYETDMNVHRLRVVSDVDRAVPVPVPPFYGSRVVENVKLEKVFEYINEVALIRGQWQVKKGSRSSEEYRRELDQVVHPKLEEMKLRAKREKLLDPRVIYGYFPCQADYNTLIIYKPKGLEGEALYGEWPEVSPDPSELEEWQRFEFPRQSHGRHLCIADFFRPVESGELDVVPFQIVTMGSRASEYAAALFAANDYADYLYFHGLSVESAEALAEYWHKSIRTELGIGGNDAEDIRRLFSQGYRGSRYSFGYAACPNLEDQTKLFAMLRPERIGVALSEEFMLEPEQSTSALVVHHPAAKYFNVRD